MTARDHSGSIVRDGERGYSAAYGPYRLRSAFQPIFRSMADGGLRLEAFEGLIRPTKGSEIVAPFAFFAAVSPEHRMAIDALCRRLHLLNMGLMQRPETALFLNFDPSLFQDVSETAREAARIAAAAAAIGLTSRQIVCEITEKATPNPDTLVAVTDNFRAHGFRIAVDDFGAEDSDMGRIELLRPDIVKFDGDWVLRYLEHAAGVELLRDMAARFRARGITTLFEGLQEIRQVDLCQEMRIDLLQGFALARPEELPTHFNERFPSVHSAEEALPAVLVETGCGAPAPAPSPTQRPPAARPFGRRQQ